MSLYYSKEKPRICSWKIQFCLRAHTIPIYSIYDVKVIKLKHFPEGVKKKKEWVRKHSKISKVVLKTIWISKGCCMINFHKNTFFFNNNNKIILSGQNQYVYIYSHEKLCVKPQSYHSPSITLRVQNSELQFTLRRFMVFRRRSSISPPISPW